MPKLVLPVPEEHVSITRPVLLTVLRQLAWLTEITPRVKIVFNGYENNAQTFDLNGADGDSAQFDQSERLKVTISERPLEEWILTQDPHRPDALAIFHDPALKVVLKPAYHQVEYRISFEYRTEDRNSAAGWLSTMTTRTAMNRAELTHSAPYEYAIPVSYYPILKEIHRLRELQGGYGETFAQWWHRCVSKKSTVLLDSAGKPRDIVFKEEQFNFLGWFDFTVAPEPQKSDSGATWSISFDYVVRFEKPVGIVFHYPFVIHNQLIPIEYSGNNLDQDYSKILADMSLQNQRYDFFRMLEMDFFTRRRPVRIPYYDDWVNRYPPKYVSPLYELLVGIQPTDLRTLFDVNQLEDPELGGRYEIKPHFLAYMKKCGNRLFVETMSALRITVYQDDLPLSPSMLSISPELVISATGDLDLRKVYHAEIGLLIDLSMLSESALDELLDWPEIALDIIRHLDPKAELPAVIGGRRVSKKDWIKVVGKINTTNRNYRNGDRHWRALVKGFSVITRRQQ